MNLEGLEPRLALAAHPSDDLPANPVGVFSQPALEPAADQVRALADAGGTFQTAFDLGTIEGPQSHRGRVGRRDRRDVMRFSLTGDAEVDIQLSDLRADIDVYLCDSDGQRIAASDNPHLESESIHITLGAGSYFLVVAPWRWWAGSTYQLSLSAQRLHDPPPSEVPDSPLAPFPDVADFGGANEWNLNAINAPEVWARGFTGQGVTVAVVDTGVDLDHPDLVSNLWVNAGEIPGNGTDDDGNGFVDDVRGWDFVGRDGDPDDRNGHGTHVAGTIAAARNGFGATGVAPDATIMPVRVLDGGGAGSVFSVAAGIRYAAQNGADIINLSLGGGFSGAIASAIEFARQVGALVVAAAGNEAAAAPGYPARLSGDLTNVISVGAFSSANRLAGFSNDVGISGAVQVDAPGVSKFSTLPGGRFGSLSGTSMAAPHAAGLAAPLLSAKPELGAAEARTLIVSGADRAIAGSDASGGINAAATVALGLASQPNTPRLADPSAPARQPPGCLRRADEPKPLLEFPANHEPRCDVSHRA